MSLKQSLCVLGALSVLCAGSAPVAAQGLPELPPLPKMQLPNVQSPNVTPPPNPQLPVTPVVPNAGPPAAGSFDPSMLAPLIGGIGQMIPGAAGVLPGAAPAGTDAPPPPPPQR